MDSISFLSGNSAEITRDHELDASRELGAQSRQGTRDERTRGREERCCATIRDRRDEGRRAARARRKKSNRWMIAMTTERTENLSRRLPQFIRYISWYPRTIVRPDLAQVIQRPPSTHTPRSSTQASSSHVIFSNVFFFFLLRFLVPGIFGPPSRDRRESAVERLSFSVLGIDRIDRPIS